jgi:CarboxypepD_reg-like domain/TonB-dependent Receptor Plug Domain/TonB dependent receptor-like, beta-barrel
MKRKLLLKLKVLASILTIASAAYAQTGSVIGVIRDDEANDVVVGANVLLKGTTTGTISGADGSFQLSELPAGNQVIVISFIGYASREIPVRIAVGTTVDLGKLILETQAIGLEEINVIASVAIDRKTPVAVSTIKGPEIEAKVGNQEFPEILRNTPSIYVTKEGGGFGDSRINVRGFDQRNTAVMINGIPVNDMENGWVYWSNWAGLSDVSSSIQVQRGLGASKLAVASVGGSINIVTNAAQMKRGGAVSLSLGNDGYQKYSLAYSTGLSEKGWALSILASHTRGNGYVDGTLFRAYSYFASVAKEFNSHHSLHLTIVGAPQWHFQREYGAFDGVSYATIQEKGIRYNPQWGYYAGSEYKDNLFSWRKNFYHKPIAFLNHYWTISENTELSTSVYASFGRGGGTGDLGRINGSFRTSGKFKGPNGVRWDDMVSWNRGGTVADFGADRIPWSGPGVTVEDPNYSGPYAGGNVAESYRNGMILRSSMNDHNWYGILSNLTHHLNDNFTITAGLDARYYKGFHYRRVENLLGLDAYFDDNDINNPVKYVALQKRSSANEIDYNDDGLVNWIGLFTQVEYSSGGLSAFVSVSGSNQGFKRVDKFLYADNSPEQESSWQNFLGGTVKAGLNYNINDKHNVFINGGFFSKQPIFDNVFINFRNDVNPDAKNQTVNAIEVGYGYRTQYFSANINLYNTQWGNRQVSYGLVREIDVNATPTQVDGNVNFTNISQLHQGIEIDFVASPVDRLKIKGMATLANWRYQDNFDAVWTPEDTQLASYAEEVTLQMKDVKVPDAAQTIFSLGLDYEIVNGLTVYGNYYMADNIYANFDLADEVEAYVQENNQAWKLPSYSLVDLGLAYTFKLGDVDVTARININNAFDEVYIAESESNLLYDPSDDQDGLIPGSENGSIQNRVYFGFGRTWNAGLKVKF